MYGAELAQQAIQVVAEALARHQALAEGHEDGKAEADGPARRRDAEKRPGMNPGEARRSVSSDIATGSEPQD